MKVREEIQQLSTPEDRPILEWLFEHYHWASQWEFVATFTLLRYGIESYKVHRVWTPTKEGRAIYAIFDVLSEFAEELEDINEDIEELEEITDELIQVIKEEEKICNYLDIPLQHISDSVLKSMRRGTTYQKTTNLLKEFRQAVPEMAIRTTLIVGYPGETEEDFQILKNWVEEMRFERLGCFTYSHEENTYAYLLEDDVPQEVKQQRANEIIEIQAQISWELNQEKIGQTFKCVIDRKEGQYFIGRTEFDSPDVDNEVLVDATQTYLKTGEFVNIKITDATEFDLYGIPVI